METAAVSSTPSPSATTAPVRPMASDYSPAPRPRPRLSNRINLRIVMLGGILLLLIGYPMYFFIDSALSAGIKDGADGFKIVDLKAMSNFPFDQTNGAIEDVPQKWRDLNGQKVVLVGEMWAPNNTAPHLEEFELVYSIAKCCFSGPPQVQHFVKATGEGGKLVPYFNGLVKVRGTLIVNVKKEAGKVASVYELKVESIEPS